MVIITVSSKSPVTANAEVFLSFLFFFPVIYFLSLSLSLSLWTVDDSHNEARNNFLLPETIRRRGQVVIFTLQPPVTRVACYFHSYVRAWITRAYFSGISPCLSLLMCHKSSTLLLIYPLFCVLKFFLSVSPPPSLPSPCLSVYLSLYMCVCVCLSLSLARTRRFIELL